MISVIIPSYNGRKYILEALESVFIQRVDMELILVDDCSTDGTNDIVLEYLLKHFSVREIAPQSFLSESVLQETQDGKTKLVWVGEALVEGRLVRIRIYRNQENLGVAASRNYGVLVAAGEYVAFLDADDIWKQDKLRRQLYVLKKTEACLCNTSRCLIEENGDDTGIIIRTPRCITRKMMEHTNYINCSSVLAKRDVMLKYPMEHSELHEDYLTWLRVLNEYEFVVGIDKPLLIYRLSPAGKSRNKLKSAKMTYDTYRLAGYGKRKSAVMLVSYVINGLKKYHFKKLF